MNKIIAKSVQFIKISLVIASLYLLSSCVTTNYLTLTVTEPAPVTMPSNIKNVGILNRSLSNEKNENLDKLDKVLTMEGKDLDKEGAEQCIAGLKEELQKNTAFLDVKTINRTEYKTTGMGIFPSPLSWPNVMKICTDSRLDALFILEMYDTDASINYTTAPVTIKGPLGTEIPAIEHTATINTNISTGWRIYDPFNKLIIDEMPINKQFTLSGRGINPMEAASAIIGRKEAVKARSFQIGEEYGLRILPYKVRVNRTYYVRGTDKFKIAKRRAQTGNWDGAAELWKQEINNVELKIAGRAHYNMAIINEINGDLDEAIRWAQKAYEDYNNKLALDYINTLKYRKNQERKLQMQQTD